jgi:hypothetical protein
MSYRITKARKAFEQAIDEIAQTVKNVNTHSYPSIHSDYIFAASIFLAHAEIENYFSDVLGGIANLYSKHSGTSRNLPPSLRAHLLLYKSNLVKLIGEKIAGGGSEKNLIKNLSNHLQNAHSFAADSALPVVQFRGVDIYENKKYPSLDNIDRVLARIGIEKAQSNINRIAKRDAVALLESLASLRTALAHNASLPGVGQQDIVNRIAECKIFTAALDRLLHEHVKKTHPSSAWNQEMT